MIKYCKEVLVLESVSIVTNGSKLRDDWFDKYGNYIDILAVSCDSFVDEVNAKIGRGRERQTHNNHVHNVFTAKKICERHQIKYNRG